MAQRSAAPRQCQRNGFRRDQCARRVGRTGCRAPPHAQLRERSLALSTQNAELFLFAADTPSELADQLDPLLERAASLSQSELTDLAVQLQRTLVAAGTCGRRCLLAD